MTIRFRDDMVPGAWRGAQTNLGLSEASRATEALPTIPDIARQSYEDARRVSNQNALAANMVDTYDAVNARIKEATKADIANPMNFFRGPLTDPHAEWKKQVETLRAEHPEALPWDEILTEPERLGYARMKAVREETDKQQQQLGMIEGNAIPGLRNIPLVREVAAFSANAITKPLSTLAQVSGGFAGAMTSPLDAAVNLIGFGAGGASKSLLNNALRNAAANAAGQMPLSFLKQGDYQKAGLPHGWDVWLSEVEGAASGGFAIDAMIRAPVRYARKAAGATDLGGAVFGAVPNAEIKRPTGMDGIDPATFKAASERDLKATREILTKSGAIDDPEIRGALEYAETHGRLEADALNRLQQMGVAPAEGMRILDGLTSGRYTREADVAADIDRMRAPPQPEIPARDQAAVLNVSRAALDAQQPELTNLVGHALEARVAEIETIVRSAAASLKEKADPATVAKTVADEVAKLLQDPAASTRIASAARLASGAASSPEIAMMVKATPEIKARLNPEIGRHADAMAMASLDDVHLARVMSGEVPPAVAVHIANHIRPEHHGQAFADMARMRPKSIEEAIDLLDQLIPSEPKGDGTLDRPGVAGIDDPTGAAAKAQTERLKADNAEALAAALAPIKEREALESRVETLKGELAKLEEEASKPKTDGGFDPFASVDEKDGGGGMFTPSDKSALDYAAKRAELHAAETQLAEAQARLNPDQEAAQALYNVAMVAVGQRRELDVYRAVAHAVAIGRRIAPEGTRIEVRSGDMRDPTTGRRLDAYYDKGESAIVLAETALDPAARMSHEAVHALVDHGLLSEKDLQLLADAAAKADGVFTEARRQEYAEAYKDRPNVEALLREEAAAHYIDAKAKGVVEGEANTIAGRVNQFFERLRNLLGGYGFKSLDDVASAILSGQAAQRGIGTDGRAQDVMFSLADREAGQSMRRDLDSLGYYSQALEAAKGLKQAKGTPEQMLAQLKSAGVKDAEIEATGLRGFVEGRSSITRDEIASHLEKNRVGLTESQRNGPVPLSADDSAQQAGYQSVDEAAETLGITPERFRANHDPFEGQRDDRKWQSYSLDPSNPTYRETVLHLPSFERTADLEIEKKLMRLRVQRERAVSNGSDELVDSIDKQMDALDPEGLYGERINMQDQASQRISKSPNDFQSGHFPEPNIVGHMMTSMTKHEGKPVYTIDQIQSDWGQKLRDGGVRDEAKIAELERRLSEMPQFDPARVENLKQFSTSRGLNVGFNYDGRYLTDVLPALADARMVDDAVRKLAMSKEESLLRAELATAKASVSGNPLVNTTDQWVNTTLRRAIRQAAEADASYIAIPHGDTVLSYNPGDEGGMRGFYGSRTSEGIVPKNLRKLLEKIDKTSKPFKVKEVQTTDTANNGMQGFAYKSIGPEQQFDFEQTGFTLFPLTDKVKKTVISDGQPMFALRADEPAPPLLHQDMAAVDRLSQITRLIEACAA